ncbi:MAG TPA: hypothetical protein VMH27_19170 [Puia sp.]|nr:hypothetical protein [Puia sp.]
MTGSMVFKTSKPDTRNRVYSGRFRTDSIFYNNQLSFISRDTALFFLDARPASLTEIACATFYRVAPINKYFQLNGLVTDYYMENDSIAARLSYVSGMLDGPCMCYYKNGQISEKGTYTKNARTGIWEYFYENGQKAKTIRLTETGAYLIDCFTEAGQPLAENGNGRFEGEVVTGTTSNPIDTRMSGPVKDSMPDGEWKIYTNYSRDPLMIEQFQSGKFVRGTSNALSTKREYDNRSFSSFESVHPLEAINHYQHNDICSVEGKQVTVPLEELNSEPYAEIEKRIKAILKSSKYRGYAGWILLDIHYDRKGKVSATSVRLYQENEGLRKELLVTLNHLQRRAPYLVDDKAIPFEKCYIVLAEANDVVIPEEVINKIQNGSRFGQN